jgi:hypothetical protein
MKMAMTLSAYLHDLLRQDIFGMFQPLITVELLSSVDYVV